MSTVTEQRTGKDPVSSPAGDWLHFLAPLLDLPRGRVAVIVGIMVAAIAIADSFTLKNLSIGVLYSFPILLASLSFERWEMGLLVVLCSVLREHFSPFAWERHAETRLISTMFSYGAVGLLLNEMARNRRLVLRHYREVQEQVARRVEAENDLRTIIESSPAAILVLDESGAVVLANRQAHVLFGVLEGTLAGSSIREFLPVLAEVAAQDSESPPYRTATTSRGRRANGETFQASIFFATYEARAGRRLAAIVADASEDLRDWQETSFESLLRSTRVLVGSVSHEIRNMCAAIALVHANLGRIPGVSASEDYAALGTLAAGLSRLATVEMAQTSEPELEHIDLGDLIDELKIVIEPTLQAEGIRLAARIPPGIPPVFGDRHGILQVFLNLTRNSVRALRNCSERVVTIDAAFDGAVFIRFSDTGPGVAYPERLFRPFQEGADASGLGLFVSRAIVRACRGELYHEPSPSGCTMVVRLQPCIQEETPGELNSKEITR